MNKISSYFSLIMKDKHKRKSFLKILTEITVCFFKHKEFPFYYFHKMLYRKNSGHYLDYLSNSEWKKLTNSQYLHNPAYSDFFRNKLLFDFVFTNANIKTPLTLAYKIGNSLYIKQANKTIFFSNQKEFKDVILSNILQQSKRTFVKTIDTMGGANCFLIDKKNLDTISKQIHLFPTLLFQEVIIQHPDINQINPNSINTIRFDTYKNENNEVVILNVLMRIGVGDSVVDNASSGGFFVKVNKETGTLYSIGRQFLKFGGNIYSVHPDTNFRFGGFKIPYFEEAKNLIKLGMETINEKLVGWDIAITPNGPLIMEGNHNLSLFMSDIAIEGYKKNEMMKEILSKIS